MSSPSTLIPEQQSTPPLSEPQRVINTFIAPSKTFTDLNRKPSWWVPWLIMALLSLVVSYLIVQKVGVEQLVENGIKASPSAAERMERLDPAQREQQMRFAGNITKAILYVYPIFIIVGGLIVAGVLMLTFNFGMSAEVSFRRALGVVFYAWLPPGVLKTLVVIASMLAPGFVPESFNPENAAATNLAAFLDVATTSRALYRLAAAVDIFNIWIIILLGIGFSCVSKVKRSTAIATVAGWYLLYVLGAAGLAAIRS